MVVVKKYGNRRLYDTSRSAYVNLEQVAELVKAGHEVQVVDAKTGEDLTQEVLLQVVMEVLKGRDLLPVPLLRRVIMATGASPWHEMVRQQLTAGMRMVLTQVEGMERMFGFRPPPVAPASATPPAAPEPPPEPTPEGEADELAALKARLADLERRLGR